MSNKKEESKGQLPGIIITGIFTVIVAVISGIFLLISTGQLDNPFKKGQPIIDSVVGVWSGTAKNGDFTMQVTVTVAQSCEVGSLCGSINIPEIPCSATFKLVNVHDNTLDLLASNKQGACGQADSDTLELLSDNTLLYISKGDYGETRGILQHIN